MKRFSSIALAFAVLTAGRAVFAQETNAPPATGWAAFESIAQENIFDPNRSPSSRFPLATKPKVVLHFTFCGTLDRLALFTGEGTSQRKGCFAINDLINGFKIMKITLHDVTLTQPDGGIIVLKRDEGMQRIDEGPWTKSDEFTPASDVASGGAESSGSRSVAPDSAPGVGPAHAGGGNESDVLRRLRERREQEDK